MITYSKPMASSGGLAEDSYAPWHQCCQVTSTALGPQRLGAKNPWLPVPTRPRRVDTPTPGCPCGHTATSHAWQVCETCGGDWAICDACHLEDCNCVACPCRSVSNTAFCGGASEQVPAISRFLLSGSDGPGGLAPEAYCPMVEAEGNIVGVEVRRERLYARKTATFRVETKPMVLPPVTRVQLRSLVELGRSRRVPTVVTGLAGGQRYENIDPGTYAKLEAIRIDPGAAKHLERLSGVRPSIV